MFRSNFADSKREEYTVKDVDGPTLNKIVDCCYTGDIVLDDRCVYNIIAVANFLRFSYIEHKCIKYLTGKLSSQNCVTQYTLADWFSLLDLKTKSFEMVCKRFSVIPPNQVEEINPSQLLDVLKSDKILTTEEVVFFKLKEWVEGNERERSKYVPDLMKYVQLKRIHGNVSRISFSYFKYEWPRWLLSSGRGSIDRAENSVSHLLCALWRTHSVIWILHYFVWSTFHILKKYPILHLDIEHRMLTICSKSINLYLYRFFWTKWRASAKNTIVVQ